MLVLSSCASNRRAREGTNFAAENLAQFKEASLSNGIPVVIKNIPSEKNIELRLLFTGGASAVPSQKSGIDCLAFELLSDSSAAVYEQESHGRYFPLFGCKADYSYYGFLSPAASFSANLEVFAASFLNAQYSHADYLREESEDAAEAFDRSENPRFVLLDAVHSLLYRNSPYRDGGSYNTKSRVSENDLERFFAALKDSGRIKIIAAGDFLYKEEFSSSRDRRSPQTIFEERAAALIERLEELFGGIESSEFSAPEIPEINIEEKEFLVRSEFAGNNYYSALCFCAPKRGDADYVPFALATLVLDSVLQRELVEHKKSALYAGSAVLNGKKSAALVLAGGISEKQDVKKELDSSLALFPDEAALSETLDMFKNVYTGRILASSQNASATLEQIASSIYYEGSAASFLNRVEKVRAATAQDVRAAFERYFSSAPSTFVLLTR